MHPRARSGGASHAKCSRSRDVIVLSANATILLCPPLSPATIKRTPRRQAALRRQRATVCAETATSSGGAELGAQRLTLCATVGCFVFRDFLQYHSRGVSARIQKVISLEFNKTLQPTDDFEIHINYIDISFKDLSMAGIIFYYS